MANLVHSRRTDQRHSKFEAVSSSVTITMRPNQCVRADCLAAQLRRWAALREQRRHTPAGVPEEVL
jgi:hypothetical protein